MKYIYSFKHKSGPKDALNTSVYGGGNSKRLTGHHETSSCGFSTTVLPTEYSPLESQLRQPTTNEKDTLKTEDPSPRSVILSLQF